MSALIPSDSGTPYCIIMRDTRQDIVDGVTAKLGVELARPVTPSEHYCLFCCKTYFYSVPSYLIARHFYIEAILEEGPSPT